MNMKIHYLYCLLCIYFCLKWFNSSYNERVGSGSERRNESAELQLHNKMVRVGLLQSFFGAIVILALWFSALW